MINADVGVPSIPEQRGIHSDVMLVWECHVPIIVPLSCHHVVTCGFHCFCGLYDYSYVRTCFILAYEGTYSVATRCMHVINALHG